MLRRAAAELGAGSAPLLCTEGQPSAAFHQLADAVVSGGGELRYHGDFDWPGLAIASSVMRRHGARPWRMGAADYLAGLRADARARQADRDAAAGAVGSGTRPGHDRGRSRPVRGERRRRPGPGSVRSLDGGSGAQSPAARQIMIISERIVVLVPASRSVLGRFRPQGSPGAGGTSGDRALRRMRHRESVIAVWGVFRWSCPGRGGYASNESKLAFPARRFLTCSSKLSLSNRETPSAIDEHSASSVD